MTQSGELVSGSITAPTAAEVANRIEFLGLVPIETVTEAGGNYKERLKFSLLSRPRAEDVTVFTRDLALLLKAGARIDDALDLLAVDIDIGRLRSVVAQIRGRVLAGESFSEALTHHPSLFPPMYVALVRVGEASGALDYVLDVLGGERNRAEAMRRKVADALRYPAFVLFAACGVLSFFLLFVIPQFAAVLQDFNAKLDPIVAALFGLSKFVRANVELIEAGAIVLILGGWLVFRRATVRAKIVGFLTRLPLLKSGRAAALHRIILPQSRHPSRQRSCAHDDTSDSCRYAWIDRQRGHLEQGRGSGSARRKIIGRACRYHAAADDGYSDVAHWRRNRAVAGALR